MLTTELDFDPYAVWLQVSSTGQRLNPYELLGLELFETNQTRLQAAILRKREMLLSRRSEAEEEVWETIHGELEAAIATLQNSERRAVLDATLRRRRGTAAKPNLPTAPLPSASGDALRCRHCQQENRTQRRFCGGCGQSLWEKCPACATELAANERFCGNCGAAVHEKRGEQEKELQEKLQQAKDLAAAHRYERALGLLRSVAALEDPRYAAAADLALAEIVRVEAALKQQADLATIALQQGNELLAAYSYDGALQVLQSIPEPFRTPEIDQALERANSQWNELLALNAEIKRLIQEKRTSELFPKLERLLSLKPDHTQATKVAHQLRDQLLAAAAKRLGEHLYSDALKLLEQIPAFARNADVEAAQDKALELSVLLSELRLAPLALPSTLALALKLVKFAPTNQEAARIAEELRARTAAKPEQLRWAAPSWGKTPQPTRVNLPVEELAYTTRLSCEDPASTTTMREAPGQFFVALGLALQGLNEAPISVNLLRGERSSLLSKIPFSFGRKGGANAAWGIDLGDSGLKALRLVNYSKFTKLEACLHIPHEQFPSQLDNEQDKEAVIANTLKTFAELANLDGARVVASLPGQRVLGRFFNLPPMAAKKVAEAVQYEARHQIPVPLEELTCSHEVLGNAPASSKEQDDQPRKVILVAARLAHVRTQAELFKSAGIAVDEIAPDSLALHNGVQFELASEESRPVALVDMGLESTNFVVSSPGSIWFRSFGMGGECFTQSLVKHFRLTREQAEELKRKPAKARRFSQFCATQEPLFVQFVSEIERSLASYGRQSGAEPPARLYGLGGGFQTYGLLRHLRWGK